MQFLFLKFIILSWRGFRGAKPQTSGIGIGEGHGNKAAVRVVDLESRARIRNGLACLRIGLDDLDIALEIGVVDEITLGSFIRERRESLGKTLRGFAAELDI